MTAIGQDSLNTRSTLNVGGKPYAYYSLAKAAEQLGDVKRLPFSMKVLLENLLRFEDGSTVTRADIQALVDWQKERRSDAEIQYRPARVLMQDFTGVPCVVDLAAMRDAITKLGGDPKKINPQVPVHLVIDHSVMVDEFGTPKAFEQNVELEYQRNMERYEFLKWGSSAFNNFKVVPPAPASATRSISRTLRAACGPRRTRRARRSPTPTPASAPTATPPWSMASACSAGAWAGSRRRLRCSASPCRC
jgi:aconitate hydratase